jgi:hypothetical protein
LDYNFRMKPSSSTVKTILLVLLGAAFIAVLGFSLATFNNTLKGALHPFQQANDRISTQVFQLLHPTPTILPDPVTIINEVRAIARLETIHYTVEKVITAEVNQGVLGPLFGDRLLFVAHGYVIAGIDMQKINPEDMSIKNGVLNIQLPKAEVLVATLDNVKSYVYDRETGLLTHGDPNLEKTARQVAEQEILKAALEDNILEQARINAEIYLEKFFNALGYQSVVFLRP